MRRWSVLPALLPLIGCATPPPPTTMIATPAGIVLTPMLDRAPVIGPNAIRAAAGEPAPLPDRAIEAPRDRFAGSLNPTFEPMLLPGERPQGVTFGSEHLRETGPDRPFDGLIPGARLRIPFE
jgi:hypothetical protein